MNKTKVLFLIESLAGGGAEKVLTTLVQHIDKNKFDVMVCAISGNGKYEDEVRQCCRYKAVLPLPSNWWTNVVYKLKHHLIYRWLPMEWVYRLFIPKGNDVEVAFVEGFSTKLMAVSNNHRARKVAWVHCDLHNFHWTRHTFKDDKEEERTYNRYDEIVTVSKTVEEAIRQEFQLFSSVRTLYNPVDHLLIRALSEERTGKDVAYGLYRLVSVGRLSKPKAYMRLLSVMKRLKAEGLKVELWLLGDGEERDMLQNYVDENELGDVVTFWGFQPNPYKYLVLCDIFVCSSLSEGFSTAITEALILGLPVISTEVSGVKEQLTNGCGLITANDIEALFEGVRYVITHPDELQEMRRKAAERGAEFRIDTAMRQIESVLEPIK